MLKKKRIGFLICLIFVMLSFSYVRAECGERNDFAHTVKSDFGEKRFSKSSTSTPDVSLLFGAVRGSTEDSEAYIIGTLAEEYVAYRDSTVIKNKSLAKLLSEIEKDGAVIEFDGVYTNEDLRVTKSVCLTGMLLQDNSNLQLCGEKINLLDFVFRGENASLRITDGAVFVSSSELSSNGAPAVTVDFLSRARFVSSESGISSASTEGAIVCKMGSVEISGGSVTNEYGTAIKNSGSLWLSGNAEICGSGFDVVTDRAFYLSGEREAFLSELSVMYLKSFDKGSFEVAFYGAEAFMESKISLFDLTGEPLPIRYFDSCEYTEERNTLCVYLPYTVKFYNGSRLYETHCYLEGERLIPPDDVNKNGYTFRGWYIDPALTEAYSFGTAENRDFSLYAGFELTAPEFKISAFEFTYDSLKHTFGFDYLSHPLDSEGEFSFVWYKDNEAIKNSSSALAITNVSDSGVYFCKLTFSYCGDFVSVLTPEVVVKVDKKAVEAPPLQTFEYSGMPISPRFEEKCDFYFEQISETAVGTYYVKITLKDFENYRWSDMDGIDSIMYFEIVRAENDFVEEPLCENIYEGQVPRVKFKLKFGTGYAEYSADGITWVENAPSSPGKYYVRIVAEGTENYTGATSSPIEFTVEEEICIGIKIDNLPYKTEYTAFEELNLEGSEFTATYNSGRSEQISLSELSVRYKNGTSFLATDTSVTVVFRGCSVPIAVKINPAEYDISGIVFENIEAVYNGSRHTPSAFCDIVGKDNVPLEIKVSGGGIDVGVYNITLSFSTESVNYKLPSPIIATLTVKPLSLPVIFSETEFVYDGTPKIPTAVIIGAEGLPLSLAVNGAGTDAGEYIALASIANKNYTLENASVKFKILKADFDLSSLFWSADKFTYNGEKHSVTLSGLPSGLNLIGYANSSFSDAGIYTAEVAFSYDERNYNSPGKITHVWQIERADYDLSSFAFLDNEVVFDGEYHYPKISGSVPVGYDGSSVSYSFSVGAKHVSEGKKAVVVTFLTKSKNYNTPEPQTLYVTILPKPISIGWESFNFVYNGEALIPIAYSAECEIKVSGAGVDAGEYTAFAEAVSQDYIILNPELLFSISKAENRWLESPEVKDVYFGDAPAVKSKALFGSPEYLYYKNRELTELAELPLSAGKYYAVAVVAESKNYLPLTSDAILFSVIPILPIELGIEISEPLVAMKTLSEHKIEVYFINNNGSKTYLTEGDYSVEYQNGECLKALDTGFVITAGGFSISREITVNKSIITLPEISPVFYDGSIKMPDIPKNSLYYTDFSGAKNAGEYKISFFLSDTDNYEFGGVNEVSFSVLKAPLTLKVNKNGSSYEVVSGTIYRGDKLSEKYYESDGKIFLKIRNPNYDLTVIPREEKNALAYVILIFIIAFVIVLTSISLYIVFVKKENCSVLYKYPKAQMPSAVEKEKGTKPPEEKCKTPEETQLKTLLAVDESYANNLISDFVAKSLITEEDAVVETDGKRRYILNLDTISESFSAGEVVNINDFKRKGLIPKDAKYVKILARGVIDKPIHVLANSFSLSAVKMIALTGGSAKRVRSTKRKSV